jgi:hypothetical protein
VNSSVKISILQHEVDLLRKEVEFWKEKAQRVVMQKEDEQKLTPPITCFREPVCRLSFSAGIAAAGSSTSSSSAKKRPRPINLPKNVETKK